jgi:glycosyltransferase involved in cell wall biosynthesis
MKLNVLHVIDHLGTGGAQSILRDIFGSNKNNSKIFLFSLRRSPQNFNIENERCYLSKSQSKYNLVYLFKLKKFIKKHDIQVLHCHLYKSQIFGYFIKLLFLRKIKLIFHEHGQILAKSPSSFFNYLYKFFLRIAKHRVDFFIAVSKQVKESLIEDANIQSAKIIILYNSIDGNKFDDRKKSCLKKINRDKFGLSFNDFAIGFASRIVDFKGWKTFIKAAMVLSKKQPNFKFFIAGTGEDCEDLLKIINKENLKKSVKYLGNVTNMIEFYSILDCLVIPSHWEGMGIVVLEAQVLSVPVIASNVPALNEIITHNKNGLLFKKKSSNDLVKMINYLYSNPKLATKISISGLRKAQKFSIENYLKELNNIYELLKI